MIDHVPRTGAGGLAGRGTWVLCLEGFNDGRTTLNPIILVPNNTFGVNRECNE